MHELTPEILANFAQRVQQETGSGGAPFGATPSGTAPFNSAPTMDLPTFETPAFSPPGQVRPLPTETPRHPHGVASVPVQTPPYPQGVNSAPVGTPSYPQGTPSVPNETPYNFGFIPADATNLSHVGSAVPANLPAYPQGEIPSDGLRTFVERIRSGPAVSQSGLCNADTSRVALPGMPRTPAFPAQVGPRPFDVETIRKDFPALHQNVHGKPLVWLDNAATTHKPQSVIDAMSYYYAHDNSNIHRAAHTLAARSTDVYEQARQRTQTFLGASSTDEIIFVRGTTEGINLVAQTYGKKFLRPGDELILSTLEHHANIVPWQLILKETGAILRVIPVNDRGEIMLEQYQTLLGPKTRLVALTHASNSLGTVLPIEAMTQMAKRYGARVLIDGAQTVAHVPVNVQKLDCDFFVFSGHKIFAPTGIGVVYAKKELLDIMPPYQGGGNMIRNVTFEETTYSEPPAKFEAGTPSIGDAVGLGAALDYVNRLGLPNIAHYEHELLQYGTEQLSRINGLRLIGTAPEKIGVLSFVLHNRPNAEVGKMLDQEGIAVRAGHHCSQPSLRRFGLESTVRPSLAFYNTKGDIDRLVDAIKRIQRM